ncbi:unnamed protein product [Cladocopium goreaui]|uniref:Phosphatidyl-N-methylethanolamine N-methyltransferase n=1 Tax=Cladocopium goreaui TaxID=2562237 RepID=A0A9P1FYF6_9DINO|nr:unnamed protein product [Cladocopium goreaui]
MASTKQFAEYVTTLNDFGKKGGEYGLKALEQAETVGVVILLSWARTHRLSSDPALNFFAAVAPRPWVEKDPTWTAAQRRLGNAARSPGLALVGLGQLLNTATFKTIGAKGVYYGSQLGYEVPWASAFPYNIGISDPQYWGVICSVWGFYLCLAPYADLSKEHFLIPWLETFWYVTSMKLLEHQAVPGSLKVLSFQNEYEPEVQKRKAEEGNGGWVLKMLGLKDYNQPVFSVTRAMAQAVPAQRILHRPDEASPWIAARQNGISGPGVRGMWGRGWGGVGHVNVPCTLQTLLMFRTCQDVGQGLGLRSFKAKGAWIEALDCLAAAQQNALKISRISMNLLLGATAQHSAWRQAGHIFAAVAAAAPDVVTCGTLIAVLGRRKWRRAFQALMDVTQAGHQCNVFGFNAAVAALEPSMWPNALSCLAARLGITDFVGLDATSWNLVISAVAAASEWQKALWLFSLMPCCPSAAFARDVISFGTALHGCALGRAWRHAGQMMQMLREETLRPNVVTNSAALKACSNSWPRIVQLMRDASGLIQPSLVTYTATLKAFAGANRWSAAVAVNDDVTSRAMELDTIFSTELIASCDSSKKWQQAETILGTSQRSKVRPNFITCSSLISCCSTVQHWQRAFSWHSNGHNGGSGALGNVLITAAAQSNGWFLSTNLLKTTVMDSMDSMTLGSVADSFAQHWDRALWWFRHHAGAGNFPAASVEMAGCAAINACEKCSEWIFSLRILSDLNSWRIPLGDQTFNSAIVACEKGEGRPQF